MRCIVFFQYLNYMFNDEQTYLIKYHIGLHHFADVETLWLAFTYYINSPLGKCNKESRNSGSDVEKYLSTSKMLEAPFL